MKTFSKFIIDVVEAVGDPIKPEQIIRLDDPEVQKNLRDAMRPSGPPKSKPIKKDNIADRLRKIMNNTILTPL